ncbi:putative ABC transporter ATP-binding protein (plasmid) [Sulfitobacter indolifex]|uniref:Subtilin transport ATP-binding protein, putative n=1 Tax=Sulfitobacter indolifex HEL-45 TaxID=391624 RepID=A0ABM9X0P0_9RHOB|nr:ABC transporter ATP-binding protein [Sulfitobacter indolifex]EDQ02986.1 subtilin transport ATP-binding protein, putative [Sulfitobacter indolifex HEL-45]UOA21222.1 putative ABC transporter ATP-binding protein [Sulfitobacter indolifex]
MANSLRRRANTLKEKVTKSLSLWSEVFALLRYSDPRLSVIVVIATGAEIGLMLGALFAVKAVIQVMAETESISAITGQIFAYASAIMSLFLAGRVVQSVANYHRVAQGYIVADYVNQSLQDRAVKADLSFYDSALYFDSLERARQAGAQRPAMVISNVLSVFRGGLMLIALVVVLGSIEWRLLPICFVAVVLVLLVQLRFTRLKFERQKELVQQERQAGYADWLMTTEPHAKEIRLWDLSNYLRGIFQRIRVMLRREYLIIERRKAIAESSVAVVGTLLFVGAGGFLLYQVNTGQADISDLVIIILLLQRSEIAGRDFTGSLSRLYDDQLFLNQLFKFMEIEPKIESKVYSAPLPTTLNEGIQVENVTFRYPGTDRPALDGASLQIRPNTFTALIGGNGSGKTTLIKLLCRLYDPQEGRITYEGTDIRELDPVAYRRHLGVIFQDFVQFAYSGRENLRISDLTQEDEERMLKAAKLTGAHEVLSSLPNGYDTILSRIFDGGHELSGGQWQKVALARAVYPHSKFIILDEPTSAIDPNAEAEIFEGFRDKMEGRGALVISHRLSTIRQADFTYVLEKGRITEAGSHVHLINNQAGYAKMFEKQGRGFRT